MTEQHVSARRVVVILALILVAGAYLRFRGSDWDSGTHLHPDERFLTMVESAQSLPASFRDYLATDVSPLNPRNVGYGFFVYGTWPMTLVHLVGSALADTFAWVPEPALVDVGASTPAEGSAGASGASGAAGAPDTVAGDAAGGSAMPGTGATMRLRESVVRVLSVLVYEKARWLRGGTDYGNVYLVGRAVSAIMDLLSVVLLFAIGARLYDRRVGLLAAGLTAFTAFHIQQSHFFTVDTTTNFFVLLFFLGAVEMVHRRSWAGTVVAGIGMGLALASKIAIWPLAPLAVFALAVVAWSNRKTWPHVWARALSQVVVLGLVAFLALRIGQPDMFVGPGWSNVEADAARLGEVTTKLPLGHWWYTLKSMTPEALKPWLLPDPRWLGNMEEIRSQIGGQVDFPPNHQWFDRTPFVFPWLNMVVWGMGLPLGLAATVAWAAAGVQLVRGKLRHLLPWLWITALFFYQGGQWVKTMRYFIVIYPLLALLAAWGLMKLWDRARRPRTVAGMAAVTAPAGVAGGPVEVGVAGVSVPAGVADAPLVDGATAAAMAAGSSESPVDKSAADVTAPVDVPDAPVPAGSAARLRFARFRHLGRPAAGSARAWSAIALTVVVLGTMLWGIMFARIYTRDHSRVAGSRWIYHNLPTAFGLTVQAGSGPGRFMPANHPNNISYDGNTYTLAVDGRLDPMRVLVPGDDPVTVDGAHLAFATDPAGDGAKEVYTATLSAKGLVEADGSIPAPLATGTIAVDLSSTTPQHVRIPFAPTTLAPGGEYYLWIEASGAPVSGRPSILAVETTWDDPIPLGLDGYGGWDDAGTSYGEGMYGSTNLNLYYEDTPEKVDLIVSGLEGADYIVISSNRVYGAIAQVPTRFPVTLAYYALLFGDRLGFDHIADIHSYPGIGPIEIPDQSAEEAWSVYDHPKVDIFAKTEFDAAALRAVLTPKVAARTWEWPAAKPGLFARLLGALPILGGAVGSGDAFAAAPALATPVPADALMLSPARRAAQRAGGTWSDIFDADGLVNRYPAVAVAVWYLALLAVAVITFPLLFVALDNLADRGWAVSRAAGLLLVSWLAWLASSTGRVPSTRGLLLLAVAAVAVTSATLAWRRWKPMRAWLTGHWRLLLTEEALFAVLFAVFLAIRVGNPDLWHPYYGGEKPMDLAYFNAVLRTVSFPPYDPWFAGGQMNYYYYGFVLIAALTKLTGIVPWMAYNLAIPSLAAMTGLGVAGVAYAWARALRRSHRVALTGGALAALLAVVAGNLFQVRFMVDRLGQLAEPAFRSHLPGVEYVQRAVLGAAAVLRGQASLPIDTGHLYWNASRAIPAQGDVEPITEFPFFTFLYADLHAHMMALPLTVLALAIGLSWALPPGGSWLRDLWRPGRLLALFLGALAIGALWPANTWDYPTYGLVAAGAIAVGHWRRFGRPTWSWLWTVALQGLVLLGLSILLFKPYHDAYIQPYAEFSMWRSVKTPLSAYLVVHGVFLFACVTWALVALGRELGAAATRMSALRRLAAAAMFFGGLFALLWLWSGRALGPEVLDRPSPWTPAWAALVLALGTTVATRSTARSAERFMAWLLVLGTALTMFVEYVVLSGDIGRMNTVFKFYIQVWVLWSVLAGVAVAALAPAMRRSAWGRAWQVALAGLVACALVYPVTAAPAKMRDRFTRMDPAASAESYAANLRPSLSGIDYQDYAVYDDDGNYLNLALDRDGIRWMEDNVVGTPVILEGFREKAYRWGSRYSIHSGTPTVIGWDWHQKQQRAAVGGQVVDERTANVREIYDTTDKARAWELLVDYAVDYVIVGEMERATYDGEGLKKFDDWVTSGQASVAYQNPGVTIYRLVR